MYQFSLEEWELLIKLYKDFESVIPIFLQDYMNVFFVTHQDDKMIEKHDELIQIAKLFECIKEYHISEQNEFETDMELIVTKEGKEQILDILSRINIIINTINENMKREDQNREERDES